MIVIVIIALVVIIGSFTFVFKGDVDFQNTLDEREGQEHSRSFGLELALFLGMGAVLLVLCVH